MILAESFFSLSTLKYETLVFGYMPYKHLHNISVDRRQKQRGQDSFSNSPIVIKLVYASQPKSGIFD